MDIALVDLMTSSGERRTWSHVVIGIGTALNVMTVLVGATIGTLLGNRFPERTRDVVTDSLGMTTLLIAAMSAASVQDSSLQAAVGTSAPVLIILGSLLVGGTVGSLLNLEFRLESLGASLQRRLTHEQTVTEERLRFVEGFVSASLIFCVGPLAILGSLSDGLGRGINQLVLKSTLDLFAALAFATSFGWGVAAAALSVLVIQGSVTLLGFALGAVLPEAHVAALTATGGLLLAGVGLRLLRIKHFPTGDLLPALPIALLLTQLVVMLR